MKKYQTHWTPEDRAMCAAGCVYVKDAKQARDNVRAVCRQLDGYDRADLIFDYPAFRALTKKMGKPEIEP
jgi:hypothetical protein